MIQGHENLAHRMPNRSIAYDQKNGGSMFQDPENLALRMPNLCIRSEERWQHDPPPRVLFAAVLAVKDLRGKVARMHASVLRRPVKGGCASKLRVV